MLKCKSNVRLLSKDKQKQTIEDLLDILSDIKGGKDKKITGSKITVELDGYVVPPAQDVKIVTATGKILATILVPEILVPMELFGRRWKHALPNNRRKSIFRDGLVYELQPIIVKH